MSRIPVVFTFDKRIIFGAAVAIKSLIDCAKDGTFYDIYIYHPDLNKTIMNEFKKITLNTCHTIYFEKVSKKKFRNLPINKGGSWTEIVYYRLMIPKLLPQYDKVIYSDVDVLFKDDLTELYNTNISDFEWGGVRAEKNSENNIGHKYFEENTNEFIHWSGLMLINCKKFREEKLFEKLKENAKNFYDRLKFFDLDLLNITCDKILALPLKYCVLQSFCINEDLKKAKEYEYLKLVYRDEEIESAKNNPAIIHYAGKPGKPWRFKNPPEEYKLYMKSIPKKLQKLTFRDFRKKLFSKV